MARSPKLTEDQIQDILGTLPQWKLREGKLHRELQFASFAEAFAFMTRIALAAEKIDHHPEWSNVYDRVVMDLVSHDAGGITDRDVRLARMVDELTRGAAGDPPE